ncbi:MAG: glycoside hydrolase family 30 protein [Capsulimonadaceae bacterium]
MSNSAINVTVTDAQGQFQPRDPIPFQNTAIIDTIEVDTGKERQPILGYGAAFTDAACYNISQLSSSAREALLKDLLSPEGMGLSVARITVGQSDYGRVAYSYDDTTDDVDLEHFSLDYDRAYILPTLRQARQINPDLYLFSSPWSPPGWMKTSGTMCGGWLRDKYIGVFARYYLRYLQEYAREGIRIDALTPQNETETDQSSKMPACYWHPEQEMVFVRDHLGPLLKKNGLDTKVWILDHNYDLWKRPVWQLNDPGMREFTDGVAWHGYNGEAEMMSRFSAAHPDVPLYWTEGGTHLDESDASSCWCRCSKMISETMTHGCRCFVAWNYALDEAGKPNIGPFHCAGFVTIHSKTREITRSPLYYALGHYSRFVKRNAVNLASTSGVEGISHSAFRNPDGSFALVLTNPGNSRAIALHAGRRQAEITLSANSITTLTWQE